MPLYGQVVLSREGPIQVPVPETGREAALANRDAILVATRGDRDGDVLIEVRRSTNTGKLGHEIFRGSLPLATGRLVIGSPLANQLKIIDVGRSGDVPLSVYVDRVDSPAKVVVLVT